MTIRDKVSATLKEHMLLVIFVNLDNDVLLSLWKYAHNTEILF